MTGKVVVIGGGTAGIEAAGQLAKAGLTVTLIEKEKEIGGHLNDWYHLFPDRRNSSEVLGYLNDLISDSGVEIITGVKITGFQKKGHEFIITINGDSSVNADALLLATGFDLFRSERKEEYGYKIYDNVITSADLENMFRKNELKLSNGKTPDKVGFVHCVGSRDEKVGNHYCSKLCCVTAVKQAIEVRKSLPESRVFCYYMDMRMGGALYEELYKEAQENYGVTFIRGKVSEVSANIQNNLIVKVEDTLVGRPLKMEIDLLVLMAGMEMSAGGAQIADAGKLKRGENRFFAPADHHFGSNLGNVRGVFYAGACTAPMNITETISHARSAAAEIVNYLKNGRKHHG